MQSAETRLSKPSGSSPSELYQGIRILFACDLPPCNFYGGPVLMSRLFGQVPGRQISIACDERYLSSLPMEGRLECDHVGFRFTNETGPLGLGRFKTLINWIRLLGFSVSMSRLIRQQKKNVVVTIAHDYLFIAAAIAARFTKTPLVLFVHDDWLGRTRDPIGVVRLFGPWIFGRIGRSAAKIYVVSDLMKSHLLKSYNLESEVQLPFLDASHVPKKKVGAAQEKRVIQIVYCGGGFAPESLGLMINLLSQGRLSLEGIEAEFHVYGPFSPDEVKRAGWNVRNVFFHGWVSQREASEAMAAADLLYLPFSFREDQQFTAQAFPTKTVDYLASGTPILLCAPSRSAIVKYARKFAFAQIVCEPSEDALVEKLIEVYRSDTLRLSLLANAERAFHANHDLDDHRRRFFAGLARLNSSLKVPGDAKSTSHTNVSPSVPIAKGAGR